MRLILPILYVFNFICFAVVFFFIILQHYYFGLKTEDYIALSIINAILLIIHALAFFLTRKAKTFIPLAITFACYTVLYLAHFI